MGNSLVSDAELCWVVQAYEPATTATISEALPVKQISAYVRLRSLARRGYLTSSATAGHGSNHHWSLTEQGEDLVNDAELPAASDTDFSAYFTGRKNTLDHMTLLRELAARDDQWVPSTVLYGPLPYSKVAIRNNLHNLRKEGLVALREGDSGSPHHWQLTEAGQQYLSATVDSSQPA